jgi:hypothetical protein
MDDSHRLAPFNPTADDAIALSFDVLCGSSSGSGAPSPLQLTSDDVVMDLGAGDGRWLMAAAERGARLCIGLEWDPVVHARGVARLAALAAESEAARRVHLLLADATDPEAAIAAFNEQRPPASRITLEDVTLFVVYLVPKGLQQVAPLLRRRLLADPGVGGVTGSGTGSTGNSGSVARPRPRVRVLSNMFAIPSFAEAGLLRAKGTARGNLPVYLYAAPEDGREDGSKAAAAEAADATPSAPAASAATVE